MRQGKTHLETGGYSKAIALLKSRLEEFVSEVEYLTLLSHCYILNDDMVNASKFLEQAKNLDPNNASVGWNEARLNLKNNNFADALAIAKRTNELSPGDVEGLGVVGACLLI